MDRWRDGGRVVVFDAAVRVIGLAICGWAGLPLTSHNARRRVWDLEQIVDGFGGIGPRHVAARLARRRSERWVAQLDEPLHQGLQRVEAIESFDVRWNARRGVWRMELRTLSGSMVGGFMTAMPIAVPFDPEEAAGVVALVDALSATGP